MHDLTSEVAYPRSLIASPLPERSAVPEFDTIHYVEIFGKPNSTRAARVGGYD